MFTSGDRDGKEEAVARSLLIAGALNVTADVILFLLLHTSSSSEGQHHLVPIVLLLTRAITVSVLLQMGVWFLSLKGR